MASKDGEECGLLFSFWIFVKLLGFLKNLNVWLGSTFSNVLKESKKGIRIKMSSAGRSVKSSMVKGQLLSYT